MWGIIHENLFGSLKDKKGRSNYNDDLIFGNPRWQAASWRDQDAGTDFDGGLRFLNNERLIN